MIYGAGKTATGGEGLPDVHVTTLEDGDKEGTLRYALKKGGNVVFKVGGMFHLNEDVQYAPDITVKGETAPWPGVTVTGNGVIVDYAKSPNAIFRHIRLRPTLTGTQKKDIFGARSSKTVLTNVSVFGSYLIDEGVSIRDGGQEITDVTLQHNLIMATMGGIMGSDGGTSDHYRSKFGGKFTAYGNVCSHTLHRVPCNVTGAGEFDLFDNLSFNYVNRGVRIVYTPSVNFVRNRYIPGASTTSRLHCISGGNPRIYHHLNTVEGKMITREDQWTVFDTPQKVDPGIFVNEYAHTPHDNYDALTEDQILNKCGAHLITNSNGELIEYRDEIDRKIIADIKSRRSTAIKEVDWSIPLTFPAIEELKTNIINFDVVGEFYEVYRNGVLVSDISGSTKLSKAISKAVQLLNGKDNITIRLKGEIQIKQI